MKGVELGTDKRMTEVIREVADVPERAGRGGVRAQPRQGDRAAASRRRRSSPAPTSTSRGGCRPRATPGYFRPYRNHDVIGCEFGGAVKNVIALAVGMAAGLGSRRQRARVD